jgi:hypothetical protein
MAAVAEEPHITVLHRDKWVGLLAVLADITTNALTGAAGYEFASTINDSLLARLPFGKKSYAVAVYFKAQTMRQTKDIPEGTPLSPLEVAGNEYYRNGNALMNEDEWEWVYDWIVKESSRDLQARSEQEKEVVRGLYEDFVGHLQSNFVGQVGEE